MPVKLAMDIPSQEYTYSLFLRPPLPYPTVAPDFKEQAAKIFLTKFAVPIKLLALILLTRAQSPIYMITKT